MTDEELEAIQSDEFLYPNAEELKVATREFTGSRVDFTTVDEPNKYQRHLSKDPTILVDVYDVLKTFDVTCPATQHAIKKLLCPGQRGVKDKRQDLDEARASIERAIELL